MGLGLDGYKLTNGNERNRDLLSDTSPLRSNGGKDTERAGGRNGQRPKGYRTGKLERGRSGGKTHPCWGRARVYYILRFDFFRHSEFFDVRFSPPSPPSFARQQ